MPAMTSYPSERLTKFMTAARQSPDFGARLLAQLPAPARAEAVRRMSVAAPMEAAKPGLKKCGPVPTAMKSFSSAQLAAYARAMGKRP